MKLLLFTGSWCQPCQAFKPVFRQLEEEYPKIDFKILDLEEDESIAINHNIRSVPTLVFIDDKEIGRITGIVDREEVVDKINSISGRENSWN